MRILVTGFEPFGGHATNPSMMAVQSLRPRSNLITRVLPVVYDASARIIRELIDTERPDAVMCLGLCARSPAIARRIRRSIAKVRSGISRRCP
jgi:pyroglutamyl-peptidase